MGWLQKRCNGFSELFVVTVSRKDTKATMQHGRSAATTLWQLQKPTFETSEIYFWCGLGMIMSISDDVKIEKRFLCSAKCRISRKTQQPLPSAWIEFTLKNGKISGIRRFTSRERF
jgi:hypothetical protein